MREIACRARKDLVAFPACLENGVYPKSVSTAPGSPSSSTMPGPATACVTRLDRLGRSLRELLKTVDELKDRGIHLVSLEERLDTSSAAGIGLLSRPLGARTTPCGV